MPEQIIKLLNDYPNEVRVELCPTETQLQHADTTSCGRWCILRQQMLHLEIRQWFNLIINLCDNSKISTEFLVDAFVCPVVGERE